MGAGASTAEENKPARQQPDKKPKPSRESATKKSLSLIADLIMHGVDLVSFQVVDKDDAARREGGCLWGSPEGLHCAREKFGKSSRVTVRWNEPGLSFAGKDQRLTVTCDEFRWIVETRRKPSIAGWLACYLHTFIPPTDDEYSVSFTEWGRLGISFAVYTDVVIPVVFTVDEPARSFGVVPGSVLLSINGKKIFDLPENASMLDFITNCDFPKVCIFSRPNDSMRRLAERYGGGTAAAAAAAKR